MGVGQARGSPDLGYQPMNSTQMQKALGLQPSARSPPPPAIWVPAASPPASLPSLLLCAPLRHPLLPERRADARGVVRNSISLLCTSPFSLSLLLSCSLTVFPFLLPVFLSPSSTPALPASSPGPIPPAPTSSPPFLGLRAPSSLLHASPPLPSARVPTSSQSVRGHPWPRPPWRFRAGPAEPRRLVRRAAPRGGGRWGLVDWRRRRRAGLHAGVRGSEVVRRALRPARNGPARARRGRAEGEGGARARPTGRAARGLR